MADGDSERTNSYEAPALRKAVRLLELLCEASEPLSVAQISQRLDLNKHMLLRLLGTLCDEGWVVQEEGPVYRVSLVPLSHFSKPISRLSVVTAAEEPIDELWEATGESSYLAIRDGDRSMGVILRQSRRDVQVGGRIGVRLMMHSCAPGKVLLAHAEPSLVAHLVEAGLTRHTDRTICDPAVLGEHLEQIVRQGYATDNEEYLRGMLCLAAPVFDYTGRVVASVGITTLTMYHTHESMLEAYAGLVIATGRKISRTLGHLGSLGSHAGAPVEKDGLKTRG
jgi:IclR family acetate operon transcriptional repressor